MFAKKCDVCEASWGDLEGCHAGAYILYYLDNEEVFQVLEMK